MGELNRPAQAEERFTSEDFRRAHEAGRQKGREEVAAEVQRAIVAGGAMKCPGCGAVFEAAPQPQAEPVGKWVMVPREPTRAMLSAGRARAREGYTLEAAWAAMLAAAPERGGE